MKNISKFILFQIMGWKIVNDFPRDIKKYIIIVAPHTSWVDFPLSILVNLLLRWILNLLVSTPYSSLFWN